MYKQFTFIFKTWAIIVCLFFSGLTVIFAQPTISSIYPEWGPVGTLVTISGTNLSNPTSLTIGGAPAIVVSSSGSTIAGLVMPGASGGNVSVTSAGGTATCWKNFTVTAPAYPSSQQGRKLTGIMTTGKLGYSVSLSADGNTALVGVPDCKTLLHQTYYYTGAALVYTRNGGYWTQQGGALMGSDGAGSSAQGCSVSLSADGNTALVGGYSDNVGVGAAWIYTRSGNTWTQQGSKLVGTGAIGQAFQGQSVCLSADGNTAIVGGYGDNSFTGAAWVYTRTGNTWTQQGSKLVGTGALSAAYQGMSVAISADGNTAVVAGPGRGTAWIFTRNGNTWSQLGNGLTGFGIFNSSRQGCTVALSADGSTAVIGGKDEIYGITAAWVYVRSGTTWTQQGKLTGWASYSTDCPASVSLSADGNSAIIGIPTDDSSAGSIYVYTRSGNTWSPRNYKLLGTGATGAASQGFSVSMSADGKTALTGGPGDNTGAGAAWVWAAPTRPPSISSFSPESGPAGTLITITGNDLNNMSSLTIGETRAIVISNTSTTLVGLVMPGSVTGTVRITYNLGTVTSANYFTVKETASPSLQQGGKLTGTGRIGNAQQGYSVSLSADGNTAIVGGPNDYDSAGAAWIYTRSGNTWTQQGSKLIGTGAIGPAHQGSSVCLSADGNTAIVGGEGDNGYVGAAWIFVRNGETWMQQGNKLTGTNAIGMPSQGCSVSLSADGNMAMVGGSGDNGYTGAAWVYTRSGNTWTQQYNKLVGTGSAGAAHQGASVSLSADGNTAILGGPVDNSYIGAAWVFTRSGDVWTQQGSKLVGYGNESYASQGTSVALSADGNTAILGGPWDNGYNGAAWVFTRSGSAWTQQGQKLYDFFAIGAANQGRSVSLSADGNKAIIGGYTENNYTGTAWVYTRINSTWVLQNTKLSASDAVGQSYQGSSVSLSADGQTAIVGGYGDNSYAGAAWVYKASAIVTIPRKAMVTITAEPAGSVCEGTPVTFTATPFNGGTPTYQWMKGGIAIPGETGPTYTSTSLADEDAITVVMTSSLSEVAGNPATSNTISMAVIPGPVPALTGPTTACPNTINTYTTLGGMSDYAWSVSAGGTILAGGTPTGNSVSVKWTAEGDQTVSVHYRGIYGCAATAPTVLKVSVYPLVIPVISGPTKVCASNSMKSVYTTDAGMIDYVWKVSAGGLILSGGTPASNFVTVKWKNTGANTVSVNYTTPNGCTAVSPAISNVNVNQVAVPTITGPASISLSANANAVYTTEAGMTGYVWTLPEGKGNITGGQGTGSVSVTWTNSGNAKLAVSYVSAAGCESELTSLIIKLRNAPEAGADGSVVAFSRNGTGNLVSNLQYEVYPAPSNGLFTAAIYSTADVTYDIQVFNSLGVKLYEKKEIRIKGLTETRIDLRQVIEGVYFVVFRSNQQQVVRKILIKR